MPVCCSLSQRSPGEGGRTTGKSAAAESAITVKVTRDILGSTDEATGKAPLLSIVLRRERVP